MQQNTVTCPNCGTNAFKTSSKLKTINRIVFTITIAPLIILLIPFIGQVIFFVLAVFGAPIYPFMIGATIITYILSKTIKEDLVCKCKHCQNVWTLKGGKKTWF